MIRLMLGMAACMSVVFSSGCATITSSEMQTVTLTTKTSKGEVVDKAKCTLKNERGSWQAESPGAVAVRRSSEDLIVECKKEGHTDGMLRAISRAAGGMFGNIILGGGIGALIDHSKGTGYDYPDNLPVRMGEVITVDRRETSPEEAAQASSSPTKPN